MPAIVKDLIVVLAAMDRRLARTDVNGILACVAIDQEVTLAVGFNEIVVIAAEDRRRKSPIYRAGSQIPRPQLRARRAACCNAQSHTASQ